MELAKEGLRTNELQKLYDEASYVAEQRNGERTVEAVKEELGGYFSKKEKAAKVCFECVVSASLFYEVVLCILAWRS